jgi:hypothetical protein
MVCERKKVGRSVNKCNNAKRKEELAQIFGTALKLI